MTTFPFFNPLTGRTNRSGTYKQYLRSSEWKKRKQMLEREHGRSCSKCNRLRRPRAPLHVHHSTYINLGDEQPGDLILLCRDCHKEAHQKAETFRCLACGTTSLMPEVCCETTMLAGRWLETST